MVYVMTANSPVPTTVFTGFLGSGKTTIISHLILALRAKNVNVVYIKNEIGESDLDAKLMRGENIVSKEILNGCICCTLVGPFTVAVEEIVNTYAPDRLIIESAGTADPASMALMVSDHPLLVRDGVISIIDVLNFEGYQDLSPVAKRQAQMTDLIVLNKVELTELEQRRRVVGYVRELNEQSPIVEAPEGKLNPDLVFGLAVKDLELLADHQSEAAHQHLDDDNIEGITFAVEGVFEKEALVKAFEALPKSVFRIKGTVHFSSGPEIVNAIFNRVTFAPLPAGLAAPQTELICIGYKISAIQEEVFQTLAASATQQGSQP